MKMGRYVYLSNSIIIRDFNLIIFFYNSLRSVIYIANSIEIFFGSVQYYMGFRYCNGGLKYCAGRDISVNSTIQPVIYKIYRLLDRANYGSREMLIRHVISEHRISSNEIYNLAVFLRIVQDRTGSSNVIALCIKQSMMQNLCDHLLFFKEFLSLFKDNLCIIIKL